MHVLVNTEPVEVGGSIGTLQPGEWLMHNRTAFECGALSGTPGTMLMYPAPLPEGGAGTLIMRSGAYGDLLLASPALKAFKDRHGAFTLSCFPRRQQIFENTDLVDGFETYPVPLTRARQYARIISLEEVLESARERHATDAFADALGVTVTDYRPLYRVTSEEREEAFRRIARDRPVVAVQPRASVANRDYPASHWSEVVAGLFQRGWRVVLLGSKGQWPKLPEAYAQNHVHDMSREGLTFRQSAALLSTCQAFVGVDSVFLHLCHTFDIPAVGLFGPVNWELRTKHAPKTIAFTGAGDCAGCYWHVRGGRAFPPDKPCSTKGLCTVLADIKPARIVAKVGSFKP